MDKKIQELRQKATPIQYRGVSVDASGKLITTSGSLLDERIVEGYGVIWGSKNAHGEQFVRGSFSKSITENGPLSGANYQIKFRKDHEEVCALFDELKEDEIGLYFRTKPLDEVEHCNELLIQLRSGSYNNFSIGFKPIWDKAEYQSDTDTIVYKESKLMEISAVAIPSDTETFAMRSGEEIEYLNDDVEDFIVSLPKSKQLEARKLITRCMSLEQPKPIISLREVEPKTPTVDYSYILNNLKIN